MYLGPAGEDIRFAIQGAMCSAALDAAGFSFEQQSEGNSNREIEAQKICQIASNTLGE